MWTLRERLFICRSRQDWDQVKAGKFFKVHATTYGLWERGIAEIPERVKDFIEKFNPSMRTHEVCKLLRRRLKLSIKRASRECEISHVTIIKIERGQADSTHYKQWLEIATELQEKES